MARPRLIYINYLISKLLQRSYAYHGDSFQVECTTGSGYLCTLREIATFLAARLSKLFLRDAAGPLSARTSGCRMPRIFVTISCFTNTSMATMAGT